MAEKTEFKSLFLDIETYSDVDLKKSGVYPYSDSDNFELLLFGYSIDFGPVTVIDIASGNSIPESILVALTDKSVTKWAHNSSFERICLSSWIRRNHPDYFESYNAEGDTIVNYLDPSSWKCTMIWSAYMGLPLSLKGVGSVLKLNNQKMSEGEDLIRYFCKPCKPTKSNDGRTRNLPEHNPVKWELFKKYNKRDVEVELSIMERLMKFPVPDFIWDEYHLDQIVNDRGIGVDMQLVKNAVKADSTTTDKLLSHMKVLTGLENPNSVSQMKEWLSEKGIKTESLDKKSIKELLLKADGNIADVLLCRQQIAKSSVKKYQAMINAVCDDSRVRGMFQFYGANRTGRFSGRLVQLQNLPQNHMEDLDAARNLVRDGNFYALGFLYDNIPQILSELIRTAFVPKIGYKFIVCDFSAIEARVIAYLAREQWRIDLFNDGGDIYCQSASQMFGVPVVKNGENGHLRQKGKIAELACIAEGSLVLTDVGLVPIEGVTTDMKVWDGDAWVNHEGVVFKGEREVITYEGLTATPDHLVWVEGKNKPIHFRTAASCGAHLFKIGNGGNAVRLYENNLGYSEKKKLGINRSTAKVYDIQNAGQNHRFTVSDCLVHNCGYGGSTGALKSMGALDMGLTEEELQPLVNSWRKSNPRIVQFWWEVDKAVKNAVIYHSSSNVGMFQIYYQSGMLFIDLPSERRLSYVKPRIGINHFGSESVTYEGVSNGKWQRIESYGPKFVENIVQAVSRDILTYAMKTLSKYFICGHVHDEVIIEVPYDVSVDDIAEQMSITPPWIEGLKLNAEGYECSYYMKL